MCRERRLAGRAARLAGLLGLALCGIAFGHPGSGIVVAADGQVYFTHTPVGIWRIDTEGRLARHPGPGNHWLALDASGGFAERREWPRARESMRPGVVAYGDAEIEVLGRDPALIAATSFPIAIGADGALYYPDVGLEERVHIKRLTPSGEPQDFATLPLSMEVAPDGEPWKALWVHGLASGGAGDLYYTEKEAVRRIDRGGTVSLVADGFEVPGCVYSEEHRGGPILRGLDVADDRSIYVAAMACGGAVFRVADGAVDVILQPESPWTPTGVAAHGDELYVLEYWFASPSDPSTWRPRVRKRTSDGRFTVLAEVEQQPQ